MPFTSQGNIDATHDAVTSALGAVQVIDQQFRPDFQGGRMDRETYRAELLQACRLLREAQHLHPAGTYASTANRIQAEYNRLVGGTAHE